MRQPDATMIKIASAFTQCVMRTTRGWIFTVCPVPAAISRPSYPRWLPFCAPGRRLYSFTCPKSHWMQGLRRFSFFVPGPSLLVPGPSPRVPLSDRDSRVTHPGCYGRLSATLPRRSAHRHEPPVEHRHDLEPPDLGSVRRPRKTRRDRPDPDPTPSLRDVLAAIAVRRLRCLGDVILLPDHGEIA